jgi:solute carrier family 25 (mitochondrial oxoglutarate transporter), member 11
MRLVVPHSRTFTGIGLVAGGIASFVSNPIEISMVRLYIDGSLPAAQRRGYRNIFDALATITRDEGTRTLWRGAQPTVLRSMVVNAVQLGVYDQAKETLATHTGVEGVPLHLAASTLSGFCYSITTLPIDNCKSKMQAQHAAPDGSLAYTSIPQAIVRVARTEGAAALWAGFLPYFCRCAGHTVGMFLAYEQIKKVL